MIENRPGIYNQPSVYKQGGSGGGGGGVEILGNLYKTKDIGPYTFALNCLWSSNGSDLKTKAGSSTLWYRGQEVTSLNAALNGSGWHVPNRTEITNICNYFNANGLLLVEELDLPEYHYDQNGNYTTGFPAITGVPDSQGSPLIVYNYSGIRRNVLQDNTNLNQYWLVRLVQDY